MLKKYAGFMFLVFAFFLSLTIDSFSAEVEGDISASSPSLSLASSQSIYRTEYYTQYYEATCSRQVQDGTRRTCSTRNEQHCSKENGHQVCHNTPITECTITPVYHTETYSCTRSREASRQVYDHTINAQIEVTKNSSADNFDLSGCKFGVARLRDSSEDYYADCDGALVRANVLSRRDGNNRGDIARSVKVELSFSSAEGLSAMKEGMGQISFNDGVVSFISADLSVASNFIVSMSVTRNRFILKDIVEFNSALKAGDYTLQKLENGKAKVLINLDKLGAGFDTSKKHTIKVTLKTAKSVDLNGVLNRSDLSNELSSTTVVND